MVVTAMIDYNLVNAIMSFFSAISALLRPLHQIFLTTHLNAEDAEAQRWQRMLQTHAKIELQFRLQANIERELVHDSLRQTFLYR